MALLCKDHTSESKSRSTKKVSETETDVAAAASTATTETGHRFEQYVIPSFLFWNMGYML